MGDTQVEAKKVARAPRSGDGASPGASEPLRLVMRQGRGRTGGSTSLEVLIEKAIRRGRNVLVADGDMRNPTLSLRYPAGSRYGAPRPQSDMASDAREWITDVLSLGMENQASVFFDFGGGDRTLQDWTADTSLMDLAHAMGFKVTGLFFCGPDIEDFSHIHSIWQAGYFRPDHAVLAFNEALIPNGRSLEGAFNHIMADPRVRGLTVDGVEPFFMPRLGCMDRVKASGLSLHDAADGKVGAGNAPLDPARRFMVKQWLERVDERMREAEIEEWVP